MLYHNAQHRRKVESAIATKHEVAGASALTNPRTLHLPTENCRASLEYAMHHGTTVIVIVGGLES
jgi:hypothetical protein